MLLEPHATNSSRQTHGQRHAVFDVAHMRRHMAWAPSHVAPQTHIVVTGGQKRALQCGTHQVPARWHARVPAKTIEKSKRNTKITKKGETLWI